MKNTRILTLIFVLAFLTLLAGCFPQPTNQVPVITSVPITAVDVGEVYTYDVNATDPDGDTLTYSLDVKPTNMSISSTTGLINWTPTAEGDYAVVVKVSDGDLDITQSFTITVIGEEEPGVIPPVMKYTITATAGTDGAINPSGDVKVKKGKDKLFTITPDTNYHIADVLVDGGSVGAVALYTFTNVTANHTIHATFAIDTYTITASADTGGSISPLGAVTVNKGANKTFTITPYSPFYRLLGVWVDGGSEGVVSTYTFTNVTADHTIDVYFILIGPVYNETQDDHYDFIQDAMNSMTTYPNDTILVMAGTYPEDVTIGKAGITLQAYNNPMPVIEGTVTITADDVTLDGFSIKNFSQIPFSEWSGIYLENGIGILVINNLVDGIGVTLGRGILTRYGSLVEAMLEDNIVRNCHLGVYVNACGPLLIRGNTIEDAAHCGIGVDSGAGVIITGNTISDCVDMGIEVFDPNVVVNFNNITGNPNFGIWTIGPQVNATDNWWGDASGPSGVGPGTGDAISINVVYTPWSTSAF